MRNYNPVNIMTGILRMPEGPDTTANEADLMTTVTVKNGKAEITRTKDTKATRFVPFGDPIFSRPDREVKMERKDRKGNAIIVDGEPVTSELCADVLLPMVGGVLTSRTSVWKERRYNRAQGGWQAEYSVSLSRNAFVVSAEHRGIYDDYRNRILDAFDKWLDTDAGKVGITRRSSAPRLVKFEKTAPATTTAAPTTPAA